MGGSRLNFGSRRNWQGVIETSFFQELLLTVSCIRHLFTMLSPEHVFPTPLSGFVCSGADDLGASRPVTSLIDIKDKATEKKRLKEKFRKFKDDAHAGIDVALLRNDEWRYASAKFLLDRALERICIQEQDGHHQQYLMAEIQGIYSFWEAYNIWLEAKESVDFSDRNCAIIIVVCKKDSAPQIICLLASDRAAREAFILSLKILVELQSQMQKKTLLPTTAKTGRYWEYAAAPDNAARIPEICIQLPLPNLLTDRKLQCDAKHLQNLASQEWLNVYQL